MKQNLFKTLGIFAMMAFLALPLNAQWARGPAGRFQPVSERTVEKLATQELKQLREGTPYLNAQGYFYVVPYLDKSGRALFSIRIDSHSGDVLKLGQIPAIGDSVTSPKVTLKQVMDKAQKILREKCLTVGKIYKNPRGIYLIEIKCKKGKLLALMKSDGKQVW